MFQYCDIIYKLYIFHTLSNLMEQSPLWEEIKSFS
jgi:hypothetical protein